jgi:3-phenylpropionate/trans-cinnamate dioxygenase ferredoxin subunit
MQGMTTWHDAGPADLAPGAIRCCEVAGEVRLLARDAAGNWHAVAALCSHALLPMAAGRVRGSALLCPHHGARFDLASGKALGPPAWTGITVYPLRLVGDRVEIAL